VTVVPADDLVQRHAKGITTCPEPKATFREMVGEFLQGGSEQAQGGEDMLSPILADGGFVWFALAGENQTPVGCVALYRRSISSDDGAVSYAWELAELAVRTSHRRQGVGNLLVDAVLRQIGEAAGPEDKAFLEIPSAFSQAAKPLFVKTGFSLETEEEIAAGPQQRLPDAVRMCHRNIRRRDGA